MDNAIKEAFKLNMCVCCLSQTFFIFFLKKEPTFICLLTVMPMGHAWLPPQCEKHLLKHVG